MNLILLGLPGAGKGTQAAKIASKYSIPHISTGDMFRAAMKNKTTLGLEAKKYMDAGELVPDEVTNGIVKERLQQSDAKRGFLLDGYPRTLNQAQALQHALASSNRRIQHVLYIKVPKDILMERLTGRFMCSNCGATYHKTMNPPKVEGTCDKCGAHDFYQREDDKPETVENRINVNEEQTEILAKHYAEYDLVREIDGEQSPKEVFQDIVDLLN
ncbi:MAG: adenylate kinase [Alkalibacterium sp.]|nr:adenylate kinase [Alkalibacterium sp.]TVP91294.1 MAG: adenylate kinase [Alkalibacterium sp.]